MRFDFNPFFNPGENLPWRQWLQLFRDQVQVAEQSGFTTVRCTEHHFAHIGYLNAPPNPILMCADLGAHFDKIRLGQAPVVLPDWHPLRVAEDVALLDNMSDGRVDFGAGRGTNERSCIQFNIDADKRNAERNSALFRECLDNIVACWTAYRESAAEARNLTLEMGEGVAMCVVIYVAETMEAAERDIRPAINHYYEFVSGARPHGEWSRRAFLNEGRKLSSDDREADWFDFLRSNNIIWVGTAEHVTEKIARCKEQFGLSHIMLLQQFPGVSIEKILASMTRFGERVVPQFQNGAS